MRLRTNPLVLLLVTSLAGGGAAVGADDSFYVQMKLGNTSLDRQLELGPLDTVDTDKDAWSTAVGYNFSRHFGAQAEYLDFGSTVQTRVCGPPESLCLSAPPLETRTEAVSLSVVSRLPLGRRTAAFGKLGLAQVDTTATSLATVEGQGETLKGHWGGGLSVSVWRRLSLLAEYEEAGSDLRNLSLGASFRF